MQNSKLVIIGAGGHGKKMADLATLMKYNLLGFLSMDTPDSIIYNLKVLGVPELMLTDEFAGKIFFHIAIGENSVRYKILNKLGNERMLASLISPYATVSPNVIIGNGTSINHNSVIQTSVRIGKCCIVDTGAIIDHDCVIGDFANIYPGTVLTGTVNVGNGAIIGAGSVIREKVYIGENTLIGAGSVVVNDIEPNVVAYGNPARVIRKRDFTDKYLR
ncbi:MAG: acetyltransferase [Bacteroidota bacterium]